MIIRANRTGGRKLAGIFSLLVSVATLVLPASTALAVEFSETPAFHQQWEENFYITDLATDSAGNVYQTGGYWADHDFDPTSGTDIRTVTGGDDFFITKMNQDGSYGWTKTISGTGNEDGNAVAIDSSGNLYIGGLFDGSNVDFNPGSGVDTHSSNGSTDAFIMKLDSSGEFQWVKIFGGAGYDTATALAISGDSLYIGGGFSGTNTDLDPTPGTDLRSSLGNMDNFIIALSTDGDAYGWSGVVGGERHDGVEGLAVDTSGNVYVVGAFSGPNSDLDPGLATNIVSSVGGINGDGFIMKLDSSGALQWYGVIGGTSSAELANGVTIGLSGDVFLTGYFDGSVDFDFGTGVSTFTTSGGIAMYVARYDTDGEFQWAHSIDGAIPARHSLVTDSSEDVYVGGRFGGTVNFNSAGSDVITSRGNQDVFITKYGSDGTYSETIDLGATTWEYMYGLATSGNDLFAVVDTGSPFYVGNTETYTFSGYGVFLLKWGTSPTSTTPDDDSPTNPSVPTLEDTSTTSTGSGALSTTPDTSFFSETNPTSSLVSAVKPQELANDSSDSQDESHVEDVATSQKPQTLTQVVVTWAAAVAGGALVVFAFIKALPFIRHLFN